MIDALVLHDRLHGGGTAPRAFGERAREEEGGLAAEHQHLCAVLRRVVRDADSDRARAKCLNLEKQPNGTSKAIDSDYLY